MTDLGPAGAEYRTIHTRGNEEAQGWRLTQEEVASLVYFPSPKSVAGRHTT
jgi:hypothetical protein